MHLICPSCRTPLPETPGKAVLTCSACSAEVDVSRAGTAAGRPRFVPEIERTGDVVAGWTLEARIGAGGMGTVYRASRDGKTVALKFLSPALAGEPEVVARFKREVKMLEKLQHPSIVRVLEHGEENGVPWFAMELVEGTDLRARLKNGPLLPEEARAVFARLFDALSHAHSRGIVHRDLKPANLLLASGGAKLADFGIARNDPEGLSNATRLTETAAIIGTFPYMSPEQRAGSAVDLRSDLFSCGVMLYEALTGRLPQGAFVPPSRLVPTLHPRVDGVVARLLHPDPPARFASAQDAALALEHAIRPRASMRPMLAAGGLAALLIAVVVPAAMHTGGDPKTVPTATPLVQTQISSYGSLDNANAEPATPTPTAIAKATAAAKPTPLVVKNVSKQIDSKQIDPKQVDPVVNSALSKNPNDRAMSNFVNAIEDQASTVSEGTPMIASCDPTIVYVNPTATSDPITKVPRGSPVSMLKQVKGFAALIDERGGSRAASARDRDPRESIAAIGGMGIGAGLPSIFSEAPPKLSPDDQKKIEELKKAEAAKQVLWYYVQLEGSTRGWILASCTTQMAQPIAQPPSSQSLKPQGKSNAPPPDLFGEKNAVQKPNTQAGDDASSAQQAPNQAQGQGQYYEPPTPTPTPDTSTYSKKSKK